MIEQEEKQILQQAVYVFGEKDQMNMLVEECAELIKAVNKLRRVSDYRLFESTFHLPTDKDSQAYCKSYWDLCSEVSDVKIMLAQAELILSKEAIDISCDRKLTRLKERMEK